MFYYHLWYLQDKQQLYHRLDSIYKSLSNAAILKVKTGDSPGLDSIAANVRMSELQALLVQMSNEIQIQQQSLMQLVNTNEMMLPVITPLEKLSMPGIANDSIHPVLALQSQTINIANAVAEADLLICAVLIPGAKAPTLVSEAMVQSMKPGSVIVDVAIDQGGIVETVDHITTHDNPTYEKHGVVHYAVANMPGAVPRTSTLALTNVTVPYALQIANKGAIKAILENDALAKGVNVANGEITFEAVATDLGYNYVSVENALNPNNINA